MATYFGNGNSTIYEAKHAGQFFDKKKTERIPIDSFLNQKVP